MLNLPSDYQTTAALEAAKKDVEPRYHQGLETMSQYRVPGSINPAVTPDMGKIALVVRAGQAVVRGDLLEFLDKYLVGWLKEGLWQPLLTHPVVSALSMQCADLVEAELYDDRMANILMRRLAWVRLYYWHDEQMKASPRKLEPGVGLETQAANLCLQKAYVNWEQWSQEDKQTARDKFHARKRVGRRWCELVQYGRSYVSPEPATTPVGIDQRRQNSHNFPHWGTHAVALFVQRCLPNTYQVPRHFETVAKIFIQRGNMDDTTFQDWRSKLDENLVRKAIKEVKGEIQSSDWLYNPTLHPDEYLNSTMFIREALASK
ncbi:hypothetical protein RIB2604_01200250 [Aspergillus luchuensis]|uniref:Uncharacterized protein n=1 Tax=Aspergillus kawachii TaxID=1069201 RepID=A0A146F7A3_ASPKA|nr:hypothetical protein RIB2604_01200250 [Aspergillus luchuensis]